MTEDDYDNSIMKLESELSNLEFKYSKLMEEKKLWKSRALEMRGILRAELQSHGNDLAVSELDKQWNLNEN